MRDMQKGISMRPVHVVLLAVAIASGCNRAAQPGAGQGGASADSAERETARLNGWLDTRYE